MAQQHARVKVNAQGRIVLPAALRCQVGIKAGDEVVVFVQEDHLEVISDDALMARIHAATAHMRGTLVSEELIAERRREAAREAEESAHYAHP